MRLRFHSTVRNRVVRSFLFSGILLVAACGDDPTAPVPSVSGTVIASATGTPVAGAEVSVGTAVVTTGADGRFVITDVIPGAATLRGVATGFEPFEMEITISAGNTGNILVELKRFELLELGDFTLYVPATVPSVRGVLVALGGPRTTGFASGAAFGAPLPAVEASLQELGQRFRAMAGTHGLAVLGTSRAAMANGAASDQIILAALQEAGQKSGRPELASAPILLYGISGGGPEASGFAARNPARVAGLFLKVPARVEDVTSGNALEVPTFVVLAELDTFIDNAMLSKAAMANRRGGAFWGLALEAGVPHHSLSLAQRDLTTAWIKGVLDLRLTATMPGSLRAIPEASGWLGDIATGYIAMSSAYSGNPAFASWLPSLETARLWKTFAKHRAWPGLSLRVTPAALTLPVGAVKYIAISVVDESGYPIDVPIVAVNSDNNATAQVSVDVTCPMGCSIAGKVTGLAPGKATITIDYGGLIATVAVTIMS